MTQGSAGRMARLAALALPPVLLLLLVGGAGELALRLSRFGSAGVLHPRQYMAPVWRDTDCFRTGPAGELMTPDCRMHYKGVVVETNSFGLNDREVDEDEPHFRVLVLGDSVTMAAGVPRDEAYHALLERQLNTELSAPGFVELYNYGRGGRTTSQQVRDLERALELWPLDAVLVALTPGNLWANLVNPLEPDGKPPHMSEQEFAFYERNVRGRNLVSDALVVAERETGLWVFDWPRNFFRDLALSWSAGPEDGEKTAALEARARMVLRHYVGRLREIADDSGTDLAFLVLWYRPDPRTEIIEEELAGMGEPFETFWEVYREFENRSQMVIYPGEVHPNRRVHALFAARTQAWLEEIGWLAKMRAAQATRQSPAQRR